MWYTGEHMNIERSFGAPKTVTGSGVGEKAPTGSGVRDAGQPGFSMFAREQSKALPRGTGSGVREVGRETGSWTHQSDERARFRGERDAYIGERLERIEAKLGALVEERRKNSERAAELREEMLELYRQRRRLEAEKYSDVIPRPFERHFRGIDDARNEAMFTRIADTRFADTEHARTRFGDTYTLGSDEKTLPRARNPFAPGYPSARIDRVKAALERNGAKHDSEYLSGDDVELVEDGSPQAGFRMDDLRKQDAFARRDDVSSYYAKGHPNYGKNPFAQRGKTDEVRLPSSDLEDLDS